MSVQYKFAHMGIHCKNETECSEVVQKFLNAFGFQSYDVGNSVIVAGPIEVTKSNVNDTSSHICIECSDINEAMKDLKAKGIDIDEMSIKRTADGSIQSVYLKEKFGDVSCHLLQKG